MVPKHGRQTVKVSLSKTGNTEELVIPSPPKHVEPFGGNIAEMWGCAKRSNMCSAGLKLREWTDVFQTTSLFPSQCEAGKPKGRESQPGRFIDIITNSPRVNRCVGQTDLSFNVLKPAFSTGQLVLIECP